MKIGIYIDNQDWQQPGDSTTYIGKYLASHGFDVSFYTDKDTETCCGDDLVFLRNGIPVDTSFLRGLKKRYPSKMFVNDPESIIGYHTKDHLLLFPELTPPTVKSSSLDKLMDFTQEHVDVILKPFALNGGKGIKKISSTQHGLHDDIQAYLATHPVVIAQQYIEGVEKMGDKRIHVIDGKAAGALLRLPAQGSYICNLSAGGYCKSTRINDDDQRIVDALRPFLQDKGIRWAGIDVIGRYLSEVNVVSPGAVVETDERNKETHVADAFVKWLKQIK